jgi:hypothetical protein
LSENKKPNFVSVYGLSNSVYSVLQKTKARKTIKKSGCPKIFVGPMGVLLVHPVFGFLVAVPAAANSDLQLSVRDRGSSASKRRS